MRLVTWNCNLSLGRKLNLLLNLQPDIAVVQECEQALVVPDGYVYIWQGNNPKKGLGVLVKKQEIIVSPLLNDDWTYFLPITLPEMGINLLATWAYNHRAIRFGPSRIGYPMEVIKSLSEWLTQNRALVAGDFNNSVVWDKPNGSLNFDAIEAQLSALGFRSAYHSHTNEALGSETRHTFFHTKDIAKTYHIDYCFVHNSLNITNVTIPDFKQWRSVSDHVPIIIELNDS